MKLLDIHTHSHLSSKEAILNCTPREFSPQPDMYYSVGLHPWYLPNYVEEDWKLLAECAKHPQVLAIGETGLDKIRGISLGEQQIAFEQQTTLAEETNKPLIIHAVKSYNEIICSKRDIKPTVPWIIHGFRGKKELAKQLIECGFYLSFGEKYQQEALLATPLNRLFLETDESNIDIHTLYQLAAAIHSMPVEALAKEIFQNIDTVFFS